MICQIVNIYVHLDRGDSNGLFARAICNDGRSYREEVTSADCYWYLHY